VIFRRQSKEKNWQQYIDKPDKQGLYRCVYCGAPIKYQGSCDICGHAEDEALGKV
jgi:rubrerythrin